ncbi:MAG: sigma 54-interacting transcriptional regulator [bacterium]
MKEIAGRYRVVQKLGSGLSGDVFSVREEPDSRLIALKLSDSTEDSVRHLEKEFFALSQLDHPGIVKVFDFGRTRSGRAYFTMEFVNGKPFTHYAFRSRRKLYGAVACILSALHYIHSKGLVHCDLKPENILSKKGTPKLLDFGLASIHGESAKLRGTMHYIAPELFHGAKPDARADLYSLGVVLYEATTGMLPFEGNSVSELMLSHSTSRPQPISKRGVDPEYTRVLMKLLEADPIYRYDGCESVLEDLSALMPSSLDVLQKVFAARIFTAPFVGRQRELVRLENILENSTQGNMHTVVIVGAEGIGKSRLVSELTIRAQIKGCETVRVQCTKNSVPRFDFGQGADYSHLVILEDAHLADSSHTSCVSKLMYCYADAPVTLVVTCEPGKWAEDLKREAAADASFTHILLEPLSRAATQDMVNGMLLTAHDPEEIRDVVYKLSGGIPLLVEEAVRGMVDAGILRRKRGRWHLQLGTLKQIAPSDRSRWIMKRQIKNLDRAENDLLDIVSLLDEGFGIDILQDVLGASEERTISAVMSLESAGLIVLRPGGEIAISNGYLSTYVRGQMPDKRLKEFHLRIARVLESPRPDKAVGHFLLGGDKNKVLRIALSQAPDLESSGRTRDACRLYEIALEAADLPEEEFGILEKLARLYDTLSEHERALDAANRAIRVGKEIKEPVDGFRVKAAVARRKRGEHKQARTILDHVIATASDSNAKCYALCELAWLYMERNENVRASTVCREATQIALANKDKLGLGRAYHTMGSIRWNEGRLSVAEELIRKAAKIKLEIEEYASAANSLNNLGVVHWNKGDMNGAEEAYKRALKEYEKIGDEAGIAGIHTNLGLVAWTRGEWDLAVRDYEKAYSIEERIGDHAALARLDNMIAVAEEHLGNWKCALRRFRRVLMFNRSRKDKRQTASSLNGIGTLHFKMGDLTHALTVFKECLPMARAAEDREGEGLCLMNLAMTKKELGDLDGACDDIEDSIGICEKEGILKDIATGYRVRAEILLALNRIVPAFTSARKAAGFAERMEDRLELSHANRVLGMMPRVPHGKREECFRKSIRIAEDLNARYELGKALFSYGHFLLETGGRLAEAVQLLRDATDTFEHLGAKRDLEVARKSCAHAISRIADMRGFGAGILQVSALSEIASLIGSIADINAVYEKVVEAVVNLLGAERGLLLLFSDRGKKLDVAAQSSMDRATMKDARTLSRGVIREAAATGLPIICDDATTDPRFNRNRSVILNNIHSLLCVPLKLREEIIGTIYVDSRVDKRLFSRDDIPFVNTLASMMAVAIDNARYHDDILRENVYLRSEIWEKYSLGNIIGRSSAMQNVFGIIRTVAGTDSTVLIEGETGTGKELVARAIHYGGKRGGKRFLTIDCSALPESLLESELFGHKRGSFTDAIANKPGLFEEADGGTVFLDEIGDAPPSVQSRLLRVLEQSEVRRVGEGRYRKVDVRIVCATNKNLKQEVAHGRFRNDLYFRLNVLSVKLPPLRERTQDIPLLANHFVRQMESELGKKIKGITPGAMRELMAHTWPGNVRELQNEIERACALVSVSQSITEHDLSPVVRGRREQEEKSRSLKLLTQGLEKRIIVEALKSNDWNRSRVAKELGLSRQGLLKKMRKHGIVRKESTHRV